MGIILIIIIIVVVIIIVIFSCNASRPHTWYPLARKKVRKVILHVGPTNSGKTHQALSRLESSSSGMFLMLNLPHFKYHLFLDL